MRADIETFLTGWEFVRGLSYEFIDAVRGPGERLDGHIDLENHVVQVPVSYAAAQHERQLSYHVARIAGVIFQDRIGDPSRGHRGWELGVFDTYDLCVLARLYDVGPGGLKRRDFIDTILEKRPWGGN